MKRKALVIDDDVFFLDSEVEYLEDKEFETTTSLTPTCPMLDKNLGVCPMETPIYDIILSDNNMPEMTGIEFFLHLQQRGCKIPPSRKAIISGGISKSEQNDAEKMGISVFHKPTSLDLIDRWIDKALCLEN